MMMKWIIGVMGGVLVILILGGVMSSPIRFFPVSLITEPSPPFVMGVIPYLSPDDMREEMNPVLEYLNIKLRRPVKLNVAADYESLARLLEGEKVHLAWFSHSSFEQLRPGRSWEALCRPVQKGTVDYLGKIIVRADSPCRHIKDLRDKVFAYVDRNSGSGYYFPNLYMSQQGIDPLMFFSKVVFTHSHDASIDGVIDRRFDAAAVFSVHLNPKYDKKVPLLRFLTTTGPIPNDPMVVRKDLPLELKQKIREAMLSMHKDPDGISRMAVLTRLRGTTEFVAEELIPTLLTRKKDLAEDPDLIGLSGSSSGTLNLPTGTQVIGKPGTLASPSGAGN